MQTKRVIIFFYLLSRVLDLLSTYHVLGDTLKNETSPVVRTFNLGWTGFIIYNLIGIFFVVFFFYYFNDAKLSYKEKKYHNHFNNFQSYLSYIFFGKKLGTIELLTTKKIDINVVLHCLFYALPISLSFIGLLASVSNLTLTYKDTFMSYLKPKQATLLLSSLIFLSILVIGTYYLHRRFKKSTK